MKDNGPVTQHEQHFDPNVKLISATNLKGIITHCNDAFEQISGFSREELVGKSHNLVRHPDMPPEAFSVMWSQLKAGRPWMGLVKNRCKNGDYYWVNAYVTPVTENGAVIGYESVRSCPAREDVQRAEALYSRINHKRHQRHCPEVVKQLLLALLLCVPALLLGYWVSPLASAWWMIAAFLIFASLLYGRQKALLASIHQELDGVFMHPLAAKTYTDQSGTVGEIRVGIMSLRAHLDTVLTRIEEASHQVAIQSHLGLQLSESARGEIQEQTQQTELVATAMNEMSQAVHEISSHIQHTAEQAEHSRNLAGQGTEIAHITHHSIEELRNTVSEIGDAVRLLAEQTGQIAQAAESIETISEQTNLLALNAAIESARAGEHGRGFSVVADEVRSLAANTRESAQNIRHVVEGLTSQANASVRVAQVGAKSAETGLQRVIESESMLQGIVAAVNQIHGMSEQMAAAVEEQALVSEEVNRQVSQIAELSERSLTRTEQSADSIGRSQQISDQLHELVCRFKR